MYIQMWSNIETRDYLAKPVSQSDQTFLSKDKF